MMSALGLGDYSSASLAFILVTAFVAGLARGFSGFGSALIFIPIASSSIGAKLASPLLLVIDFVAAAPLIPNGWRHADRRDVGTMLLGSVIGVPIGAWALTRMDALTVRWMIVALIVPMLALLMSGWRYRGTPTMAVFGIGLWLGSHMFGLAGEETFRRICYTLIALAPLVSLPLFDGWLR